MQFPARGRAGETVTMTAAALLLMAGGALAEEQIGTWAAEVIADGMTAPNLVTHAGDGSGRLFVVDQIGQIRIIDDGGNLLETPFLDIGDRLVPLGAFGPGSFDERGLLGLAFAPDYAKSGQFYVYYSAPRAAPDPITFEIGDTIPDVVTFEDGIIGTQGIPQLYCTLSQAFEIPAETTGTVQFHEDVLRAEFQLVHKEGASPGMLDVILDDGTISETIVSPLATVPCDPANHFTVTAPGLGRSIDRLELHAGSGDGLTLFLDDLEIEQFNHDTRVSRFTVSAASPDVADPDSEMIIFQHPEPQFNHNSGTVAFGPDDGMLYISFGDGGNGNDLGPHHTPGTGNGQDITNLWGSILRIDVSGGDDLPADPLRNYAIPKDNIFAGVPGCADGCDEIWAYGLRNPFRCSFDAGGDHAFYCGDAGQALVEEVSIVSSGDNMGWPIREGSQCFDMMMPTMPPAMCPDMGAMGEPLVDPIMEYGHIDADGPFGQVVIGGFIYRGSAFSLDGAMFFGDFSKPPFGSPADGSLFLGEEVSPGNWVRTQPVVSNGTDGRLRRFVNGFGQGPDGEVYVCTNTTGVPFEDTGAVLKIVPSKGDCDGDVDVDLTDFGGFQLCFTGAGGGPVGPECTCSDFDNDGDVDLNDFGGFQLAFTGSL